MFQLHTMFQLHDEDYQSVIETLDESCFPNWWKFWISIAVSYRLHSVVMLHYLWTAPILAHASMEATVRGKTGIKMSTVSCFFTPSRFSTLATRHVITSSSLHASIILQQHKNYDSRFSTFMCWYGSLYQGIYSSFCCLLRKGKSAVMCLEVWFSWEIHE